MTGRANQQKTKKAHYWITAAC